MNLNIKIEKLLTPLYGNNEENLKKETERFLKLSQDYEKNFEEKDLFYFSTPGRTEISGNHTDHNYGRVIAASVNLDSIAIAARNNTSKISLYSDMYEKPFEVNISELSKIKSEEGTTNALLKGIAARIEELGFSIGGFNAVLSSNVLPGSGLSSSASIEVLIGSIFNVLFNEGKIPNAELAKIGQWAENNYFGKPCGLMDQMACAIGGIIEIDFRDPINPIFERVDFDFESQGYKIIVVDTGGNHSDLTNDYASIPYEMKSVASSFDKTVCRELDPNYVVNSASNLRKEVGDRAILRALHFFDENERVGKQIDALKKNDFKTFLNFVQKSGDSSFKKLQNIYTIHNVSEQGLSIGLAFSERFIDEKGSGVCRVHGGGFAGTIQVFIKKSLVNEYVEYIEKIFGTDSAISLDIRNLGTVCLNSL